jgi:hypothetical protein
MNPKSKTVWEQWIEKVEAAWPIPAVKIAQICDCDERTAARIRDAIADKKGEEPIKLKNGAKRVELDESVIEHIVKAWPISSDAIGKKFCLGSTLSRRLRDAAIARHNLRTDIINLKAERHNEMQFAKLDAIRAQSGDDNLGRHDLRVIVGCSWSTISKWKRARGITMQPTAPTKTPMKRRNMASIYEIRKAKEQAAVPVVKAKPQHYAPGRWFRNKRSGETVPALFVVAGSEVKFFGVTT